MHAICYGQNKVARLKKIDMGRPSKVAIYRSDLLHNQDSASCHFRCTQCLEKGRFFFDSSRSRPTIRIPCSRTSSAIIVNHVHEFNRNSFFFLQPIYLNLV